MVHRQRERCFHVYHVASGYVKFEAVDSEGHGLINSLLSAGDFFGCVTGTTRRLTRYEASAKGPVRLYRCKAHEFGELIEAQPDFMPYLVSSLDNQLSFVQRRVDVILHHSVLQRVAHVLCELEGLHGGRCRHGHEVDVRLSQEELAQLVGASRPVVSTVLNELRQRGLVGYTRTFICIENRAGLSQLIGD